jgi:hypothetical protein
MDVLGDDGQQRMIRMADRFLELLEQAQVFTIEEHADGTRHLIPAPK